MLLNEIQRLEDLEQVECSQMSKTTITTYIICHIINLFDWDGSEAVIVCEILNKIHINFFESLCLIAGERIIVLPFLSSKLRKILERMQKRYAEVPDVIDSTEQKLNKLIDELDEVIMKEQMRKDAKYLFNFFQKKPVGA